MRRRVLRFQKTDKYMAVSAATAVTATPTATSSAVVKVCFNSNCKESLEKPQKGWRLRTGEFAELCDRCA